MSMSVLGAFRAFNKLDKKASAATFGPKPVMDTVPFGSPHHRPLGLYVEVSKSRN